jgi:hypothetical protein
MTKTLGRALLLVWAIAPAAAQAQQAPLITLAPEDPARWDAAGLAGWFGGNRAAAAAWDDWSDAASFGASAGYYWTPHIKIDGDVAVTTWGRVFVQEPVEPRGPFPSYRFGEDRFRSVRGSGAVVYQFLLNTWLHPYVAAGVEASREWSRRDLQEQAICTSGPCPPIRLTHESTETTRARPMAAVGFKWYFSERAFVRSEIRATFSARRTETVQWRAGMGVDF